ncbi:MAG TPA: SGNH/GDSL hydrolase family protein [Planctomycetota bacterium]|jgi:acyl-CoA thioesterase-1|nr:SGNH/GDSL hydrolase family protein [Planctomycetota bacterium]
MRLSYLLPLLALLGCSGRPTPADSLPSPPYRVLILGDSISIGYTPFVREMLAGKATVVRPMAANGKNAENCSGTNYGKDQIGRWLLLEGGAFDVIHFNFGLHDLKHVDPNSGKNSNDPLHPHQAKLKDYTAQLRSIAQELQASGAQLIFATTTPVPKGDMRPFRDPEDVVKYNAAAWSVMSELGIPINDLYRFALPRLTEIQQPANVHFTPAGSRLLAERVAEGVRVLAER